MKKPKKSHLGIFCWFLVLPVLVGVVKGQSECKYEYRYDWISETYEIAELIDEWSVNPLDPFEDFGES